MKFGFFFKAEANDDDIDGVGGFSYNGYCDCDCEEEVICY